jgi:hypothetical protein
MRGVRGTCLVFRLLSIHVFYLSLLGTKCTCLLVLCCRLKSSHGVRNWSERRIREMASEPALFLIFDSELECCRPMSVQDDRCAKAVDYSLEVDVAIDGLPTCLGRATFAAVKETTVAASLGQVVRRIAS